MINDIIIVILSLNTIDGSSHVYQAYDSLILLAAFCYTQYEELMNC